MAYQASYTPEPSRCAGGEKPGTRILQDWACNESPLSHPSARMSEPGAAQTAPARGHHLTRGSDMPKITPPPRLDGRVQVTSAGCWEWMKYRTHQGYGAGTFNGSGGTLVHRWAYETLVGPVPPGLEIDHLCGNRACCNPEHLEAVPHSVNVARGRRAQQTHCIHGHEFTPENTKVDRLGRRQCRECKRISERRRYRRNVAAKGNR
jgi:hypothetical protein